jgi:ADP-heptose:LPS heptosyltransferase
VIRHRIRRILIHRLGSLGDTIVALPSFHLVRAAFPEAHVTLLTNCTYGSWMPPVASILDGSRLVDDYLEYPRHLRDPRQLLALRRRIAKGRFDCVVYLSTPQSNLVKSMRDALFFLGCGIARQVGVPYRRTNLHPLPIPGTDRFRPEAERLTGCLRRLGRPDLREDRWWDLRLTDGERGEAEELLGKMPGSSLLLAVCVGTKVDVKDWTEANWMALFRRLAPHCRGQGLVAVGSQNDSDRSQCVLSEWEGPTLNLCGKVTARVSAAVLQRCALFLGHDSGPMHLASSVGTPCVAIFSGQSLPGVWYPRGEVHRVLSHSTACRGCHLDVCHERRKECILSISVDRVFQAVVELLQSRTRSGRNEDVSLVPSPFLNATARAGGTTDVLRS